MVQQMIMFTLIALLQQFGYYVLVELFGTLYLWSTFGTVVSPALRKLSIDFTNQKGVQAQDTKLNVLYSSIQSSSIQ